MPTRERAERAQIFQSFDALEGFREIIKAQERKVVPKPELTEDDYNELNDTIHRIEKGMIVKVVYYENHDFVEVEGMVSKINLETKMIQIVKEKILFKTIYQLKICDENHESDEEPFSHVTMRNRL